MRFLADAGISPRTVEFLKQLGHEAEHVRTLGMQRASDLDIVEHAQADRSVVVTFDLDFGEILALGVLDRPSVIILRLQDERATFVNDRLVSVLEDRQADLEAGALVLVEDDRYRSPIAPQVGIARQVFTRWSLYPADKAGVIRRCVPRATLTYLPPRQFCTIVIGITASSEESTVLIRKRPSGATLYWPRFGCSVPPR